MTSLRPRIRSAVFLLPLIFLFLTLPSAFARQNTAHSHPQDRVYLVFPFESVGTSASLDWLGEGLEELTIERLSRAGEQVYSHAGRLGEMDRYGIPGSAKLSHATMLRIAQDLDADFVVFGSFSSDGKTLTVQSRLLRVNPPGLLPVVSESGPLDSLMDLSTRLAWRMLVAAETSYPLSLNEFAQKQPSLRLDAFEQYIRGLLASEDEARLKYLKEAARLEPSWADPAFAIGEVYFDQNDCDAAIPWFSRVPVTHELSVEAVFATGVCRLEQGQSARAAEVFESLRRGLQRSMVSGGDMPEILNNLALARAREGNYSGAISALTRAGEIDPDEDDFPFNLGLISLQQGDWAAAAGYFREAKRREGDNPEDWAFLIFANEKLGKKEDAAADRQSALDAFGEKNLPVLKPDPRTDWLAKFERVKRDLDTTSLRLELEDVSAPSGATSTAATSPAAPASPASEAAAQAVRQGRRQLRAGQFDAAEKEFQEALALEPSNATAHRELGELYRRRGNLDAAVRELQLSLASRDSAAVRTTLARVYLEQKKSDLARIEVEKAIQLAPNYAEAKELLDHMEKSKPTGGTK